MLRRRHRKWLRSVKRNISARTTCCEGDQRFGSPTFCSSLREKQMSKVEAFLSHKAKDEILAKQIQEALGPVLPSVNIFLSEEIGKSKDFRKEIWTTLAK